MPDATAVRSPAELSRWKLFLALSRTPHAVLDLATPALGALLCLGRFPPPQVLGLGLATAFAGYTAVYALNDLVDYRSDCSKAQRGLLAGGPDLDGLFVRHPMAQGLLTYREGLFWVLAWSLAALGGAYRLSPVCALVFLLAAGTEAAYCLLLRVHHLRTLVSGLVKISGGVAAILAVDPRPSPLFLGAFALWLFLWEIGGQNVPNDLADLEEDRELGARTLPVAVGRDRAASLILAILAAVTLLAPVVVRLSPGPDHLLHAGAAVAAGAYLLLVPALRLFGSGSREDAAALFNRSSYYPLAVLVIVAARVSG
ncbi:MAG: UbiA family prenyltransferase [Deltaproteobacteria bacterium]|nr:UbiA family prenyltransferase [Deltaproteobacteria bacterium]